MKRLLILTGSIWLLVAMLGSLVIMYGRARPIPLLLDGMDTCGGVTCYLGIIPGRTTWSEAVTTWGYRSSTATNLNYGSMDIGAGTPIQTHLMQSWDLGRVTFVQIKISQLSSPTLGTALVRYRNPCALTLAGGVLMMRYPDFILDLDAAQPGPLKPRTAITGIFLNGSHDLCAIRNKDRESAWRGFATYFNAVR